MWATWRATCWPLLVGIANSHCASLQRSKNNTPLSHSHQLRFSLLKLCHVLQPGGLQCLDRPIEICGNVIRLVRVGTETDALAAHFMIPRQNLHARRQQLAAIAQALRVEVERNAAI